MVIFAAGNKYKMYQDQEPKLVHDYYYVYAFKWIKSKQEWRVSPATYNVGKAYEVVEA